jgi:glycosyltransferase involved in cell wall biosynthesis
LKTCVIVSAHASNWRALHYTLLGYAVQSAPPDELIVAEDSESDEVEEVVARHARYASYPLRHLRQPNNGFGKWLIVNRAIAETACDWLVFTDADCLPRRDLLWAYGHLAAPGRFVAAGSHVNLPIEFHERVLNDEMVLSQQVFSATFLRGHGVQVPRLRVLPEGPFPRLLDRLTARDAFVGNNSGAWRSDLLRVAGFDEVMRYGGADRNIGVRLNNVGVRGVRARHSLVCLHLDHARGYRNEAEVAQNKAWNRQIAEDGTVLPRSSALLARAEAPARSRQAAALAE